MPCVHSCPSSTFLHFPFLMHAHTHTHTHTHTLGWPFRPRRLVIEGVCFKCQKGSVTSRQNVIETHTKCVLSETQFTHTYMDTIHTPTLLHYVLAPTSAHIHTHTHTHTHTNTQRQIRTHC